MKRSLYFNFVIILILSCFPKEPESFLEYKYWFNNPKNGFIKSKVVNGLEFKVQYRPVELQILNELDEATTYSIKEITRIKKPYLNSMYFLLEVGIVEAEKLEDNDVKRVTTIYEEYKNLVRQLSFKLEENVKLIAKDKVISPSICHFERSYELANRLRFIFAFSNEELNGIIVITLVYEDPFFIASRLSFKFNLEQLKYPKLPINLRSS